MPDPATINAAHVKLHMLGCPFPADRLWEIRDAAGHVRGYISDHNWEITGVSNTLAYGEVEYGGNAYHYLKTLLPTRGWTAEEVPQGTFKSELRLRDGVISLRDYFAGQAIAGIITGSARMDERAPSVALWAYQVADAMLAVRETDHEKAEG